MPALLAAAGGMALAAPAACQPACSARWQGQGAHCGGAGRPAQRCKPACVAGICSVRGNIHTAFAGQGRDRGPSSPLGRGGRGGTATRSMFRRTMRCRAIMTCRTHRLRCCPPPVSARAPGLEGDIVHRLHGRLILIKTRLARRKSNEENLRSAILRPSPRMQAAPAWRQAGWRILFSDAPLIRIRAAAFASNHHAIESQV